MTKHDTKPASAWSAPVIVEQIPEGGLHRNLAPDDAVRAAMAQEAGLRSLDDVSASLALVPAGQGRIHVTGTVTARVGQSCVVTLDPVETAIAEPVDLMFAPPDQIPDLSAEVDDEDTPDSPEPIENGIIDLGRLATDVLYLAIDPYPRKPDAVFDRPVTAADPQDHPFAGLKALQDRPRSSPKKPGKT